MNYTITKTQGDYIDRHNGKTRSGKYYKVECEHDGFTLYYPGSYTKKRVLELTKGNFGFDVEIEYINKLTNLKTNNPINRLLGGFWVVEVEINQL